MAAVGGRYPIQRPAEDGSQPVQQAQRQRGDQTKEKPGEAVQVLVSLRPSHLVEETQAMSDFLFTSESVSEGHPDKVADQISDAVLDAILKQDTTSRVAAETLVKDNLVVLAGEITTNARVTTTRRARDDPAHRLQRPDDRLRRRDLHRARRLRPAVARHRAGRRRGQGPRPRAGRGRPGPDVRLRLRRDAEPDAAADLPFASPGRAPGGVRRNGKPALAAARREVAGHGALRERQARRASTPSCSPRSTPKGIEHKTARPKR